MKNLKNKIGALFLLTMLFSWQSVHAQFAGDVFFAEPSIAIGQGGQGQIEVLAFMGASTFGATQVDLHYNPAELSIVSVKPGTSTEVQNGFTFRNQDGVLSIIALNSQSATDPIGTVSLALVDVQPLSPAGSRIFISSNVDTMLRQDSTAYSFPRGFGMEIVVTSASAAVASTSSTPVTLDKEEVSDDVYRRALELRSEGAKVKMMLLNKQGEAVETLVQTRDDNAVTEEVDQLQN